MPYNIMVVDDEPMIRFGLVSCLDWPDEGFSTPAEASNGEAALALIAERRFDVIITDIKMPLMDGLELTRRTKQLLPDVMVVLVSSFSDFEYAREAVKLGVVVDYLLKPTMEPEDLQRVVRKCKERLDEIAVTRARTEALADRERISRLHELALDLPKAIKGLPISWQGAPDWMAESMILAVWRGADQSGPERLGEWREQLSSCYSEGMVFVLEEEIAMLLADRRGNGEAVIRSWHARLCSEGHLFTVGISPAFTGRSYVREAYEWAREAAELAFFQGSGRCYTGRLPASPLVGHAAWQVELEMVSSKTAMSDRSERFSQAFTNADAAECQEVLKQLKEQWKSSGMSRQAIISQARGLLTMMWSRPGMHKRDDRMEVRLAQLHKLKQAETLDLLVSQLTEELQRQLSPEALLLLAEDHGGAHAIQLALSYIQEHYLRDLTLSEVAEHVHMSKNYFSEQFKRRSGLKFIDFVIRLRIQHAKRLLETTNFRVLEIGEQSGFNSPKHFLKLFKRVQGCTPAEYREGMTHKA